MGRCLVVGLGFALVFTIGCGGQDAAGQAATQRAMSGFAAKLVAAMPAGWRLTGHAPCGAPHRWSGGTTGECLSFKHDSLDAVFPPGRAAFSLWIISASYAARQFESGVEQPGGAWLGWVSEDRLLFVEGGLPGDQGRADLDKAFESLGFKHAASEQITPAAAKTLQVVNEVSSQVSKIVDERAAVTIGETFAVIRELEARSGTLDDASKKKVIDDLGRLLTFKENIKYDWSNQPVMSVNPRTVLDSCIIDVFAALNDARAIPSLTAYFNAYRAKEIGWDPGGRSTQVAALIRKLGGAVQTQPAARSGR